MKHWKDKEAVSYTHLKEIEIKREIEKGHPAPAYGRYQNVFLTDGALADLQASFPTVWGQYIDCLLYTSIFSFMSGTSFLWKYS